VVRVWGAWSPVRCNRATAGVDGDTTGTAEVEVVEADRASGRSRRRTSPISVGTPVEIPNPAAGRSFLDFLGNLFDPRSAELSPAEGDRASRAARQSLNHCRSPATRVEESGRKRKTALRSLTRR